MGGAHAPSIGFDTRILKASTVAAILTVIEIYQISMRQEGTSINASKNIPARFGPTEASAERSMHPNLGIYFFNSNFLFQFFKEYFNINLIYKKYRIETLKGGESEERDSVDTDAISVDLLNQGSIIELIIYGEIHFIGKVKIVTPLKNRIEVRSFYPFTFYCKVNIGKFSECSLYLL